MQIMLFLGLKRADWNQEGMNRSEQTPSGLTCRKTPQEWISVGAYFQRMSPWSYYIVMFLLVLLLL